MIESFVTGDIFKTDLKQICFAVNVEGINDSGFAGLVGRIGWPELNFRAEDKMGDILTKEIDGKVFRAFVCHSLGIHGWNNARSYIQEAFDKIPTEEGEVIASVFMGAGPIGKLQGADTEAIKAAMEKSKKLIRVYSL